MDACPSTPAIVCLECGDRGYSNAFVYCVKCLECAVHRYCLEIIPKSVDEYVRWICDDCEAGDQNQHPLHSASEDDLDYIVTGMKRSHDVAFDVEKHVYEDDPPQSHEACTKINLVECTESNNVSHLVGPRMSGNGERCESSSYQSDAEAKIKDNDVLSADTSLRGSLEKRHKGMETERKGIDLSRESEICEDIKLATNYIRGFSEDHSISSMADFNMCAAPVLDPIWSGSFSISNNEEDILEGVMAHISIAACRKVYNEARQFKPVLHLEMFPRSHVWPKSFEQSEPDARNIALYFFPSERSEQVYDDLVDKMVEDEVALKGVVENAELLVFPSTKLPLSYWRFQGKYYLWGVFRKKQAVALRTPAWIDGEMGAKMKSFCSGSPLSPASNCSSYGSCNPLTKSQP